MTLLIIVIYFIDFYTTPFLLDYYTGILTRKCEVEMALDRETVDRYEFTVKVMDTANHEVSNKT